MAHLNIKSFSSLVNYGSHLPLLIKAMEISTGPVVEMGMGVNSTPVMHWMCAASHRNLVSYETDESQLYQWSHFSAPRFPWHYIELVKDWDEINLAYPWSLAFVDHDPDERRHKDVLRLADHAQLIVLHDSEGKPHQREAFSRVYDSFKWSWRYSEYEPESIILSNFVDLSGFHV